MIYMKEKTELEGYILLVQQESGYADDSIQIVEKFEREGGYLSPKGKKNLLTSIIKENVLDKWEDWEEDGWTKISSKKIKITFEIIEDK